MGGLTAVWFVENNIVDVPDVSAGWYLDVVRFAESTPGWFRSFAGFFTEAAIVLLLAFMAACWWRARGSSARSMAFALLAPAGVAVAYSVSEVIKTVYEVERPCRTLGGVATIAECPPPGDWSFPSNHSVIAGAAAIGILLTWRALGLAALALATGAAASRVFVGAHYPHDAMVGLTLGALIAAIAIPLLSHPTTALVGKLRDQSRLTDA